jgi:P4 family phage/plasmid primase-like protien
MKPLDCTLDDYQLKNLPLAIIKTNKLIRWGEITDKKGNVRKTPICSLGRPVGYNDPAALITSDEAEQLISGDTDEKVGITLLGGLPIEKNGEQYWLWVKDFDGFAERDGTHVDDGVKTFLDKYCSYTEMSPSGTGFKYFFLTDREPTTKFKIHFGQSAFAEKFPDVRKYRNREIEVFSKNAFMALTGELFNAATSNLSFISGTKLDEMLDELHEWAISTGGTGHDKKLVVNENKSTEHHDTKHSYSKLTQNSLKAVLGFIDHEDEQTWTDVCNALARVYDEDGRQYFQDYSQGTYCKTSYENYSKNECDARFNRALGEVQQRSEGYGVRHLLGLASWHSNWDGSCVEYEYEDDFDPLPWQVDDISAAGITPPIHSSTKIQSTNIDRADVSNAERFAEEFRGKILFVLNTNMVLSYAQDVGWTRGDENLSMQAAKLVLGKMADAAAAAVKQGLGSSNAMLTEVKRTSKRRALEDMVILTKSEPGMSVPLGNMDNDPMKIGVNNGVVDLMKGQLVPPSPKVLVTKRANVVFDPDTDCPQFKTFLSEIMPNDEVRQFLVQVLALLLTGTTKEQRWFFFLGEGLNGKSVILTLLEWMLKDYATKIPTEMLMRQYRSTQQASPDLLNLQGKRFVYCNETKEGQRLDDARIKDLTGGDTITGRALYANESISFSPTHKLVMAGNHRPIVSDDSHGFWRRVVVIPFDVTIPPEKIDPDLLDKLKGEASGIFNLLLSALSNYQQNGMKIPETLKKVTNAYKDEEDVIGEFIREECLQGPEYETSKLGLYRTYHHWCERNGMRPMNSRRFSRRLTKHGFRIKDDQRTWAGISDIWDQPKQIEV